MLLLPGAETEFIYTAGSCIFLLSASSSHARAERSPGRRDRWPVLPPGDTVRLHQQEPQAAAPHLRTPTRAAGQPLSGRDRHLLDPNF